MNAAEQRSSEIDVRILGWTIRALGDDDSLEQFFEAILGFFDLKLVKNLERDSSGNLQITSQYVQGCDGWLHVSHFVLEFRHGISQISSGHHLQGHYEHDTLSQPELLHLWQSILPCNNIH